MNVNEFMYIGIFPDEHSQPSHFIGRKVLEHGFYSNVGSQGEIDQIFCYLTRNLRLESISKYY
ncbi:unnamed protein product [Cunninghamella echinulata]